MGPAGNPHHHHDNISDHLGEGLLLLTLGYGIPFISFIFLFDRKLK